jgi:GNAT superfamily N-acetyltransferase
MARAVRDADQARPAPARRVDWHAAVDRGRCWVWADGLDVQGFAVGDPAGSGEVRALCVRPDAQGRGAGSALLAQITDVLWAFGYRRLTVGAPPRSRGERMCRAAGWTPVGRAANGDVRFARDL